MKTIIDELFFEGVKVMNKLEKNKYLKDLYKEKEKIEHTISKIEKDGIVEAREEIASELSFYDNHPADLGEEISDISKQMAIRQGEKEILDKINSAIDDIKKDNNYGVCKNCGKNISKERLDFIPYARYCITCQKDLTEVKTFNSNSRPIEEEVLGNPFGYGYNDSRDDQTEFDAEDCYQSVEIFNKLENTDEYYDENIGYVEEVEKISNEQYKNSLPD